MTTSEAGQESQPMAPDMPGASDRPNRPVGRAVARRGSAFAPRFDASGLLTAVVTDAGDGTLLMVAHMNAEALAKTLETGIAHYWSRSRRQLWKKGEDYFRIVEWQRMAIEYKTMKDPLSTEGVRQWVTKKEFCRLIKDAELVI